MRRWFARFAIAGIIANEIRGLILAGPILLGMAQANTTMAVITGLSMLGGVALSALIPVLIAKRLARKPVG